MKLFKLFILLMSVCLFFLVSGCKEAAKGADEIADQVTGKTPIEKKIKMEKAIKKMSEENNKKTQEALDKIK